MAKKVPGNAPREYAPELIEAVRRDYEDDSEDALSVVRITRKYKLSAGLPTDWAKQFGWKLRPSVSIKTVAKQEENGADWFAIRLEYETTPCTHRALAAKHGVALGTISRRCVLEKWNKFAHVRGRPAAK